ncbi:chemotaxis protein CheC [Bacillus sp. OV322]|uniref:chemotaxis protein CheC n=1 Tax=Bacillus sp. OV322 TaxID=1882764 RepID=UPI0008EF75E7|nr:chemotaxis protein CheC [Bacillus sp. OV322]SFC07650.1 chemotaxis protein CheC [Bacillus sp. OV322]
MSFIENITALHLDILKEIGNIGAGNAATSLSALLDKKIEMKVPQVRILSLAETMELSGGAEAVVASVFLRIEGDAHGSIFFVLPLGQAAYFIRQMTKEHGDICSEPFSDLGLSALQEAGNILSGSYLSALSNFTGLDLYPTVPELCIDMAGAQIGCGILEISQSSDYVIAIDTALHEAGTSNEYVNGHFLFLPDSDAFEIIFASLGAGHHD